MLPTVTTADPTQLPRRPEPPLPDSADDALRWQHTRLRRRLLSGTWDEDLISLVNRAAGTRRANAWKMVDLSANVFRSSMQQVAVQYDRAPFVMHQAPAGRELANAVAASGFWRLQRRQQRNTLGLRETLVRLDVARGRPLVRPVTPDFVAAEADPDAPDRPAFLREAVLRGAHGQERWTWEEWDIRDRGAPSVRVVDDQGKDLSALYLRRADGSPAPEGGLRSENYTWRWENGDPFLPYVLYHADTTGQLWDAFEGRELVAGSLNIALMWSFWGHVVRNAAWRRTYGINVRAIGGHIDGPVGAERQVVEMDPAALQLFEADEGSGQPTIAQLDLGADPMVLAEAVAVYERRIAAFAGISPTDVQRVAGDPRSGFALAITREGQREAQQRYQGQFEVGDQEVLSIAARLLTQAGVAEYPVDGYALQYQTVPESAEEREARRRHVLELLDRGLIDKVAAYQEFHPGVSDVDAVQALERIRGVNEELSGAAAVGAAAGAVQDTALNGAQVQALAELVSLVATRQLPRESAVAIIARSFSIDSADAERMLGPVGRTFFAPEPAQQGVVNGG